MDVWIRNKIHPCRSSHFGGTPTPFLVSHLWMVRDRGRCEKYLGARQCLELGLAHHQCRGHPDAHHPPGCHPHRHHPSAPDPTLHPIHGKLAWVYSVRSSWGPSSPWEEGLSEDEVERGKSTMGFEGLCGGGAWAGDGCNVCWDGSRGGERGYRSRGADTDWRQRRLWLMRQPWRCEDGGAGESGWRRERFRTYLRMCIMPERNRSCTCGSA